MPVAYCNRRGFSAEKQISLTPPRLKTTVRWSLFVKKSRRDLNRCIVDSFALPKWFYSQRVVLLSYVSEEDDLQEQLGIELADMIHYIVAIAAINDIDLPGVIIEKDKKAAVKYHHRTNLESFLNEKE